MNRLAVLFTILTAFFVGHTANAVTQEATQVAPEAPVYTIYTNCKAVTDGLSDRCVGEISPEIGGHIVHYNNLDGVLANGVIPPANRDIEGCIPREVFFFSRWTGWNGDNGTSRIVVRDTADHTWVIPSTPQEGAGYWSMSFQCPDTDQLVFTAFNVDWWSSSAETTTGVPWHMNPNDETSLYPGLASYGSPTRPQVSITDDGNNLRFAFNSDILSGLVLKGNERYGTRPFEIRDCAINSGSTGWEPHATVRATLTIDERGYALVDFPMRNIPQQEWMQFSCLAAGSQTVLSDGVFLWLNVDAVSFDGRFSVDKENGLFMIK